MTPKKTQKQLEKDSKSLSASIMLAIDLESNFKLYSYRCLTEEQFKERTYILVAQYKQETKQK